MEKSFSDTLREVGIALKNRPRPAYYNENGGLTAYGHSQCGAPSKAYWPSHQPNDLPTKATDWRDNPPE